MKSPVRIASLFALVLCVPAVASAQLSIYQRSQPSVGEQYTVELAAGLWDPTPAITISSSRASVIGSTIDVVGDLGIVKTKFREYSGVLRLAKKHKILFEYIPITYTAQTTLSRAVTFGGVTYTISLPVASSIDWKAYRIGYEYDFLYRDRGFLGVVVDVRYNNLTGTLSSSLGSASAQDKPWVPTLGVIARGYVAKNFSLTGEVTAIKVPDGSSHHYFGHYVDLDAYATVNFSNNFGVQGGYRSLDVSYHANLDTGTITLKGVYARVVARF